MEPNTVSQRPIMVDGHLDLSMNAMEWNRDLRKPLSEINLREAGKSDLPGRGNAMVSIDALRKGNIGLVFATQIARYVAPDNPLPGWHSPEQAWAHTQAQLAWYREMELEGVLRQVTDRTTLLHHLNDWRAHRSNAIGYLLTLEGSDSIVTLHHLERAYASGLRALGPAHYGPGRYAQGTNATGGIGTIGKELLREMEHLGIILDATHLCDDSFQEVMDHYRGPVWASHHNCRSIVDHNRQFNDDQLRELISRGAVIGGVMDAWMMVPNWQKGVSTPHGMNCGLERLIDHMDHICQLAGNANHIAIGSDLDGGFGKEQSPFDLESIADLDKLPSLLAGRGYKAEDIDKVTHSNWLDFLLRVWK